MINLDHLNFQKPPSQFSTKRQQEDYEATRLEQQRTQRSEWCVSPLCFLDTPRGRLQGGMQVTPEDVFGNLAALAELRKLGVLIQVNDEELLRRNLPAGTTHIIGPRALITPARGVIDTGMPVAATDFISESDPAGTQAFERLIGAGRIVPIAAAVASATTKAKATAA